MFQQFRDVIEKCRAILFDFDGVVADTEPLKYLAYQQVFWTHFRIKLPKNDAGWKGKAEAEVISYWFEKFHLTGDRQTLITEKRDRYREIVKSLISVPYVDGLIDFYDYIRSFGLNTALITGSQRMDIEMWLKMMPKSLDFDEIITANEIKHQKPNPEGFLKASKLIKVNPNKCVVIEDSLPGIEAAKKAKMHCLALTTSHSVKELRIADWVANNYLQLLKN